MNYVEIIKNQEAKFKEIAQGTLDFGKEQVFAIQQFTGNHALLNCDTQSVQLAILNVALTGLSLNPSLAYAYLIPRKGKCVLDISYRGLIQIAYNAGAIKNIRVELVRANDVFKYEAGSVNRIFHEPDVFSLDRGDIIGVYSIATYINNETSNCVMARDEVEFIKSKSQAVKAGKDTIWRDWEGEMYKKTVLKRHFKMLPKSERLLQAVAIINEHEGIDFTEKEEKPVIAMPKARNATGVATIGQEHTHDIGMVVNHTETENEAHRANKKETQNYEFIAKMQQFKKALTEQVYREWLQNVIGVDKSSLIVDPQQQVDVLQDIAKYCREMGVKVQEVSHAKK